MPDLRRWLSQMIRNLNLWEFTQAAELGTNEHRLIPVGEVFLKGSPAMVARSLTLPFQIFRDFSRAEELTGMSKRFVRDVLFQEPDEEWDEALCLDAFLWHGNYWHWIMECLPKVLLAEEQGFAGLYLIPDNDLFAESMSLLGIAPERVRRNKGALLRIKNLYVSPRVEGVKLIEHLPLLAKLRDRLVPKTEGAADKRYYLTRNLPGVTVRRIVNEDQILPLLERFGFEPYCGDGRNMAQQMADFAQCRAVFGPHGAAFTNALFMPPEGLLLEATSPHYIYHHIQPVIRLLRHRHFSLVAVRGDPGFPLSDEPNLYIDPVVLETILLRELEPVR